MTHLPLRYELRSEWTTVGDTAIASAFDTLLERDVTLKRHLDDADDARLLDEAKAVARTRHMLLPPIHDVYLLEGVGLCLVLGAAADRLSSPSSVIPAPLASMLVPPMQDTTLRRRQNLLAIAAIFVLVALYWMQRSHRHNEVSSSPSVPTSKQAPTNH